LSNWCQPVLLTAAGRSGTAQPTTPSSNPLLDTGLAFAGYNTDPSTGLITARDFLEIDLWGNQLTILIACSSGTGTISQGAGIFGLKRALSIVGARTLIVSLWDVPRPSHYPAHGKILSTLPTRDPRPQALQQSQRYIRDISTELAAHPQGRIILQEIDNSHETTHLHNAPYPLQHPMFWGAWICQSS
jgi:CHAT domain-containing protein